MKHFLVQAGLIFFIFPQLSFGKAPQKSTKDPMSRESLMAELTGKDDSKLNDIDLYAEIVAAYQGQDQSGLKSHLQKLLTKYPQSSFADNALYLAGRQALDRRSYGEALKYFQRVQTEYPRSNRVVSAQFAKAMAYKKMNLEPEARKVFKDIMAKYPGSPESFRADNEMRMLN